MEKEQIIGRVVAHVKETLEGAEAGHDWFHVERVWKTAIRIGEAEGANMYVTELAALLHDIADSKFHGGDETIGPGKAREFLTMLDVEENVVDSVEYIIRHISFKGGHQYLIERTRELNVVQDADRLDAMGAIGIARAFNYGGFKNRKLYDPSVAPNPGMNKEAYKNNNAPTLNHFYEKLLLLKDKMNTETGRELAAGRHRFLEVYLRQFFDEWNGEA